MAMERNAGPTLPRLSASSAAASPSTVGALLAKASAAAAPARECPSPRSLLSRILHRGGGGGFGCRLRLPRYCSIGAAKEDADEYAAAKVEAEAATPKVVGNQAVVRESPRSSLGTCPWRSESLDLHVRHEERVIEWCCCAGKKAAEEVSPASLGLGASLVLLLSKSSAELKRMAELRAQMERLVLDVKGETRSINRPSASDDHADSTSVVVVKPPIAWAGGENGALSRGSRTSGGGNAAHHSAVAMDQMEAELEAELTRLQFATSNNDECATPRRDRQLETELKSDDDDDSTETHATTFADDDTLTDQCGDDEDEQDNDDEESDSAEEETGPPAQGGVSARELERRLHELLQSQHEERIAELETALERAKKKLQEKEREVFWWRNTAKLVTRHKDDSRLISR
ncbi:hypothetical protein E2562_002453 [Oryza meyeriana var. granulata]|uniref:Protein POLAR LOCALIZATION DURING ASYMMETRIC DIVISION AND REDISTRIBUTION n=1 Tax=Oryza meyeriana var. granulata TaxID=110450 RepID=A0A6G1F2H4_9ORYZ|nr:hypothetical protein E2562_002453 [Oryza meyeriana var. granulata]KAF0931091.1 hypothetical protein E2562_002453 [Oryza meyeriana var. granulata]